MKYDNGIGLPEKMFYEDFYYLRVQNIPNTVVSKESSSCENKFIT